MVNIQWFFLSIQCLSKKRDIQISAYRYFRDNQLKHLKPLEFHFRCRSFLTDHSFKTGIFPTTERTSIVTPIYKSEGEYMFSNYRPISVINVISKVVEKIAFNQLSVYFESNNLFSSYQYGFRKKRSTQHAVTNLVNHVCSNMDKGNKNGVLNMDFSKAFETVNHSCLLHKLPYYGITENELLWVIIYSIDPN